MSILAVYSIKGGVGKTAAAVNLAYLAAQEDEPTLLVDLDPQGAASFYCRIRAGKKFNSRKLIRGGKGISKGIKGTDYGSLDALPASLSYRKLDLKLDEYRQPRKRIRDALRPFAKDYAHLILDCPPGLTLIAENVLVAADRVLLPVIPTTLSVNTYDLLFKFCKQQKLDRRKILPFFSMVEKRKKMHRDIIADLRRGKDRFLDAQIPYSAEVEKMGLEREPLFAFSANCKAAKCYRELWAEVKSEID